MSLPCASQGDVDGYGAVDALVERDEGFGGYDALNLLYFVVEQIHEVLVVAREEFEQHGVGTRGEVAFHNFGNVLQPFGHAFIHGAALQFQSHIGAGAVANALGAHGVARTCDDAGIHQTLHTLVNGSARHAAHGRHVLEGDAGIHRYNLENFQVELVNLFHGGS